MLTVNNFMTKEFHIQWILYRLLLQTNINRFDIDIIQENVIVQCFGKLTLLNHFFKVALQLYHARFECHCGLGLLFLTGVKRKTRMPSASARGTANYINRPLFICNILLNQGTVKLLSNETRLFRTKKMLGNTSLGVHECHKSVLCTIKSIFKWSISIFRDPQRPLSNFRGPPSIKG